MPKNNDFIAFFDAFPNENACRKFLENNLWPNGKPVCPHCKNSTKIYRYKNGKLFKCGDKVRIKGSYRKVMNTNKAFKTEDKEISPHASPQKNKAPVFTGA